MSKQNKNQNENEEKIAALKAKMLTAPFEQIGKIARQILKLDPQDMVALLYVWRTLSEKEQVKKLWMLEGVLLRSYEAVTDPQHPQDFRGSEGRLYGEALAQMAALEVRLNAPLTALRYAKKLAEFDEFDAFNGRRYLFCCLLYLRRYQEVLDATDASVPPSRAGMYARVIALARLGRAPKEVRRALFEALECAPEIGLVLAGFGKWSREKDAAFSREIGRALLVATYLATAWRRASEETGEALDGPVLMFACLTGRMDETAARAEEEKYAQAGMTAFIEDAKEELRKMSAASHTRKDIDAEALRMVARYCDIFDGTAAPEFLMDHPQGAETKPEAAENGHDAPDMDDDMDAIALRSLVFSSSAPDEAKEQAARRLLELDPDDPFGKYAIWTALDDDEQRLQIDLARAAAEGFRKLREDVFYDRGSDTEHCYFGLLADISYTLLIDNRAEEALAYANELLPQDDHNFYGARTMRYGSILALGMFRQVLDDLLSDEIETGFANYAAVIAMIELDADRREINSALIRAISFAPDVLFFMLDLEDWPQDALEDLAEDLDFEGAKRLSESADNMRGGIILGQALVRSKKSLCVELVTSARQMFGCLTGRIKHKESLQKMDALVRVMKGTEMGQKLEAAQKRIAELKAQNADRELIDQTALDYTAEYLEKELR